MSDNDTQSAETMSWSDYDGRSRSEVKRTRIVRQTVDVRSFLGTPIYPWLIIAANPHLSSRDIELWLALQSKVTPGAARSLSWIKRRQWMTRKPGTPGVDATHDRDRTRARAIAFMAEHPGESSRSLAFHLKRLGMARSKSWVQKHRCDGLPGVHFGP